MRSTSKYDKSLQTDHGNIEYIFARTDDECEDQISKIMREYNLELYEEGNMTVTEEEFVYDSMRNLSFCQMLSEYCISIDQQD